MKGNGHASSAGWDDDGDPYPPRSNGADKSHHNGLWLPPTPWIHDREPIEELDFAGLAERPDRARRWVVPNYIPLLETTGLGGPTSAGKTLIAQQLATCVAVGRSWVGMPTNQMQVAMVLNEDYHDDAHQRQADVNRHLDLRMADLAGRLKIITRRRNMHNYLGIFDREGELHTTSWFDTLLDELKAFAAEFVILDTRADIFRGDQNNEGHARQFVRKVTDRIAQQLDGAVMMLYQPSRAGRKDGSGESGSVQWDSAFRARFQITDRPTGREEDEGDGRLLEFFKSTWSKPRQTFDLLWRNYVFELEEIINLNGGSLIDRIAQRSKAQRVFIKMFDQYWQTDSWVSSSESARNYAPRVFSRNMSEAEGCTMQDFESALHTLLRIQHVFVNNRHERTQRLEKAR